jgi:hypothetical protein
VDVLTTVRFASSGPKAVLLEYSFVSAGWPAGIDKIAIYMNNTTKKDGINETNFLFHGVRATFYIIYWLRLNAGH